MGTSGAKVEYICKVCGTAFQRYRSEVPGQFCSQACKRKHGGKMIACGECGNEFFVYRSSLHRRQYCSIDCKSAAQRKQPRRKFMLEAICKCCQKPFRYVPNYGVKSRGTFCSSKCRQDFFRMERKFDANGYVIVWHDGREVKEHRLVMEQHLGRPLAKSEHIHHINEIRTDNRLENLQIVTAAEHRAIHNELARQRKASSLPS